jgi:hypothetical protein
MTAVFGRIASLRTAAVALMLALSLIAGNIQPVSAAETAGQRSTRNIILGALAATGIIIYSNYQRHAAYARSVVGYTRDGGVVYGDGRIVYPNGQTIYTSNNGQSVCTFDGEGQQCNPYNMRGYYPQGYYSRHSQGDREGNNDDENDDGDGGGD